MVRFDPKSPTTGAATAVGGVPTTAGDSGAASGPGEIGLGPLTPSMRLGAREQLALVDNLTGQLERLARRVDDGDGGRADAMVRGLLKQDAALREALLAISDREDPDAGAALRDLGRAVGYLKGRRPELDALLDGIGALPGISRGRVQGELRTALEHGARFMAAGRGDLAQLVDRYVARRGQAPFYEVRARLREIDAHRVAGRPEFVEHALERLEEFVARLETGRVSRVKALPDDPAGGPPMTLADIREAIAAARARPAAPANVPVAGHEAWVEAGAARTAHIPDLIATGQAAGQVYTPELKAALAEVRAEALAASPMSAADATFLVGCIDWKVPRCAAGRLSRAAAEMVRLTNGVGLAALHEIRDEAPNPRAGYGGIDTGYMHREQDLWHELFHHVEYMLPDGFERAWSFIKHRASHDEPRPMPQLSPELGFPPDLKGYDAPMITPYAAVVKTDRRATETVSIGGEHWFDPGASANLAVHDLDHLRFALGLVLATHARPSPGDSPTASPNPTTAS